MLPSPRRDAQSTACILVGQHSRPHLAPTHSMLPIRRAFSQPVSACHMRAIVTEMGRSPRGGEGRSREEAVRWLFESERVLGRRRRRVRGQGEPT